MKKHFLKSFALIAMLFSAITMSAKQYCQEPLTLSGGATIQLSCELVSAGNYRITIEGENLAGLGGSFYNPGGVDLRTAITTNTATKIVCDIEAASAPTLYTPLYVLCPGEQNIGWPNDIDWTGTCGEGGEDPVDPTPEPETPDVVYCDFPTGHEGNATFGDPDGRILVSVIKKSETTVRLVVKSADAATKNLDLLYVEAAGANPHATTVGSDVAESDLREMSVDITYPTAPAKYNFMIQWSHPNWAGRWQTNLNDITVEQLCTEGGETGDLIVTEYCYYTNELLTKNGAAIALTWETADNGDVVITMDNGIGAESCSYRNGGFEGGIEAFVVSTDNFVTTTPASDYFTFEKVFSGNEARLVNIADLAKGAKIMHIGSGHALAWTVNGNDEYCYPDFIYTYGGVCNKLEAPSNVVVTDAGVVTFDEVLDATSYEVRVYQGVTLKYTQEITNGGTINFEAYVAGEYTVKVVAKAIDKGDSLESDGVTWNVAASPLPMSNYCESLADAVTANNGSCSPYFSWVTDAAGNVVITVSASEGNDGETTFRGTGMNGEFKLESSVELFNTYFDRGKTDDYIYTLTLKDAANKPLPGAVISFSGQIEAKSSINGNDWSNYVFNGYLYGTNCTVEDTEKPVMGTATLLSNTYDIAIVEVTATDDMEVAKYRVVDESNDYDKSFKPADGKITITGLTPSTKYTLTITALDLADNESENSATVEVTTEAHNYKPLAAPTVPTVDAKKVIAVYSDVYPCSFSAMEGWGQATQFEELNFEGNHVRYYTNFNYLGWATATPINALNMEKLHLDIWAENTGSLKVTPIYGGAGLQTDDQKGLVVELQGQQWNAIEFDLTDFVGLDFSSIFQFKFDIPVGGNVFAIDNVYFYRETEIADTEAPTDVVATLKSASYTSVVITCQAADNSGTVSFDIFDGETKLATSGAESGKPVDVTVAGLEAGKTYNLSVVAYDINENKAAAVSVEATTLALPVAAPAPTHAAENVYSIYSNAYTSSVYFIIGGWGQATVATEVNLAAEDKAYLLQNTNYLGWEINNNLPIDVSAYNKVHLDVYALAGGSLQFTPISLATPNNKENVQTLTLKEGWNQFDIDCATFTGVEFDKIIQVKFAEGGNATYFIDNVYFHKVAPTDPTGVENNMLDNRSMKVIENGRLFIIRNGVTYDVTGRVVR